MLIQFELDPEIIHHIIYNQAGSIGKAVIELIMNSVDAHATVVRLNMTNDGFDCTDDGRGFISRKDVLRYFGRFGTPHQVGDATYGRFRLGRGQIMAHAKTEWITNNWVMCVDAQTMGYSYDLEERDEVSPGCTINGTWYETLTDQELMSALQEIRDLVRYTPIRVELNGKAITRDPASEKWDFEDEWAYYRAKAEGPVSIYNQGVLVRNDPSDVWGAGGLIVSKQAINLNVSRTEILRKTCPVWKPIAVEFKRLASEVSARLGDNRKTEARRARSARSLLEGSDNILDVYWREEVITLLPGKRHITLMDFLSRSHRFHRIADNKGTYTLIENSHDVPKGEAIARDGVIQIIHPLTLERFGCHNSIDFVEALDRALSNINHVAEGKKDRGERSHWNVLKAPVLLSYTTFKDAFVERMQIVDERQVLDKETRRAWTALRWCLQHYVGACTGARRYKDGTLAYDEKHLQILLGDSNTAEAWTDGKTYIAINCELVKRIGSKPLEAVAYIFGVVEHEVAHQGDSIDSGHDEAFYQRYHDISLRMAPERQRFMHKWLMKYTMSLEREEQKAKGAAWRERWLIDRVGSGREKRGLSRVIEDVSKHAIVSEAVPEQNLALMNSINTGLVLSGATPEPPNWDAVREQARIAQLNEDEQERAARKARKAEDEEHQRYIDALFDDACSEVAKILGLAAAEIPELAMSCLTEGYVCCGWTNDEVRAAWAAKTWATQDHDYMEEPDDTDIYDQVTLDAIEDDWQAEFEAENADADSKLVNGELWRVHDDCRQFVFEGETYWALERNAAAAGFQRVEPYLKWRHQNGEVK
ncbi:ATP-binding protein [Pseudomonas fragariae (ex Marin et al. 2024)]|uniref:ATP-binding protein n=1 Tax=Pseudomonas fragariae (ex Marin et al. 2024) TaxID=3080056 RepID=UPI003F78FA79